MQEILARSKRKFVISTRLKAEVKVCRPRTTFVGPLQNRGVTEWITAAK